MSKSALGKTVTLTVIADDTRTIAERSYANNTVKVTMTFPATLPTSNEVKSIAC
jgi:hypothetical protein